MTPIEELTNFISEMAYDNELTFDESAEWVKLLKKYNLKEYQYHRERA